MAIKAARMRAGDGAIKNFSVGGVTLRCSLAAGLVLLTTWQTSRAAEADWALPPPGVSGPSSAPLVAGARRSGRRVAFSSTPGWRGPAAARGTQRGLEQFCDTTTGMLEQRFRFDGSEQQAGNGADTRVTDGGKGLDLIVSNSNEVQIAAPAYELRDTPTGKGAFTGFGDWAFLRVKQKGRRAARRAATDTSSLCGSRSRRSSDRPADQQCLDLPADIRIRQGLGRFRYPGDNGRRVAGVACRHTRRSNPDQCRVPVSPDDHPLAGVGGGRRTHYVGGQRDGLDQVF